MYTESSFRIFFDDLASKKSSPGGGSVCAMMGLQAISLVLMVAYLTVDKKQYEAYKEQVASIIERSLLLKQSFMFKIDEDVAIFSNIMSCYGLAKEERSVPLKSALVKSAFFSLSMAEEAFEVLELALIIGDIGNKSLKSDAYIALLNANAAIEAAFANVRINLASIKDASIHEDINRKMRLIKEQALGFMDKGNKLFREYQV